MTPPAPREPERRPVVSAGQCVSLTVSAVLLVVCVLLVRSWAIWITPLLALAFINEVWRRRHAQRRAASAENQRRLP